MQDRFRFRAWNKENKEMIYNAEIAYDGMNYNTSWQIGKNTNDGWVDCFGYYLDYPEDYEVMQCTGLKDKNGKLIYEGDVVERKNGFSIKRGVVYFNEVFTQFDVTNMSHYSLVNRSIVLGNIYENPELLENN